MTRWFLCTRRGQSRGAGLGLPPPGGPGRLSVRFGRLQQPAQGRVLEVLVSRDLRVAQSLPWPPQQPLRVGQLRALVEAQVHVVLVEGDVAEVLAHLLGADAVADDVLPRPRHLFRRKERLGDLYRDHGLVFTSGVGTLINPTNLRRRSFAPLLQRAGLPQIRFHDLRHTCATLLLTRNVHPKYVQELLGHATVAITPDT